MGKEETIFQNAAFNRGHLVHVHDNSGSSCVLVTFHWLHFKWKRCRSVSKNSLVWSRFEKSLVPSCPRLRCSFQSWNLFFPCQQDQSRLRSITCLQASLPIWLANLLSSSSSLWWLLLLFCKPLARAWIGMFGKLLFSPLFFPFLLRCNHLFR